MTVAIGIELSSDIGPAASASSPGNSGHGGGLRPGAAHLSGDLATRPGGGAGSLSAESFHARWQSELAAIRVDQGDVEGEQITADSADAATGEETKSGALPGLANGNIPVSRQASGANGAVDTTAARNREHASAIQGRYDVSSEAGPIRNTETAESPESKDAQNGREVRKRDDTRGQARADSQKDAGSLQSMTGVPMGMAPVVVAQQPIQVSMLSPEDGMSMPTGALTASAAGKTAGGTKTKMATEGGLPANAQPATVEQPPRGVALGSAPATSGGLAATAGNGQSLAEDGVHDALTGEHDEGPRGETLLGSGGVEGGRGLALPAAASQGTHNAAADAQGAVSVASAQGDTSQSAAAPTSAAQASSQAQSAARPGRSSKMGASLNQNPGQSAVEASAALGRQGGGMATTPAAGAPHSMSMQPAGTAAGMPGSGSGNGSEKSTGETFAAMDAQANNAGLTWVHAGPHQAEAGFQDPALGWVAVRAEAGAGGIHAAIVPGTADAAQTLGGHMAGLSAHLAEQRVSVNSVSINNPGGMPELAGGGTGQNGGQQGAGPGQNQGQHQPSDANAAYPLAASIGASGAREIARSDQARPGSSTGATANGVTGRHISVVA